MEQYIKKSDIVAEIKKWLHQEPFLKKDYHDAYTFGLESALKFLDTLEVKKEPVSEDLEEAAKKAGQKYFPDENNIWARPNYEAKAAEDAFKDGVNWQKKQMIDKACEFLKSYRQDTPDGIGYIAGIIDDKTIEEFKQAMKE